MGTHDRVPGDGSAARCPPNALSRLAEVRRVVRLAPRGLITDVDGTISQIVWPPERAVVSAACRSALQRLLATYDLVGIVSGRSAREARRMVGLGDAAYVGQHGLEEIWGGRLRVTAAARRSRAALPVLLERLERRLDGVADLFLERKAYGLAVHFRTAADPRSARQTVLAALGGLVDSTIFRLVEGRKVVEVRPRLRIDKGTAVRRLIRRYGVRAAIYLGDDVTDVDAFRAIRQLRWRGTIAGLGIVVTGGETPPEVTDSADLSLSGVDQVATFLERLVQE